MGTLEDIKQMQQAGKSEADIRTELQGRGVAESEITTAMSQSKIKDAVSAEEGPAPAPPAPVAPETAEPGAPKPVTQEADQTPQPSLMAAEPQAEVPPPAIAAPPPAPVAAAPAQEVALAIPEMPIAPAPGALAPAPMAAQQGYGAGYGGGGYAAAAPAAGLSTDTITEISEQVMADKLKPIKNQLEKVVDLKTTIESKQEALDDRLKRIEKIIDRLQVSILQKIGDYVTSVEDVKKELSETQKSFKAAKKTEHRPAQKKKMAKKNHKKS